jgi:hypothetical protein
LPFINFFIFFIHFIIKMSCSSTRTSHNICVPGCPEDNGVALCPCPVAAAFACRPLCPCPELEDNVFFSQGRLANEICLDLLSVIGVPQVFSGTAINLQTELAETKFAAVACPAVITLALLPVVSPRAFLELGTVKNGAFTVPVPPVVIADDETYEIFVNGKSCGTVVLASP